MRRKTLCIILTVLMCFSAVIPVAAAIDIQPLWLNAKSIYLQMTFSGGQVSASSTIDGKSNTTSIKATYSLQEKNGSSWNTVHTWSSVSTTGKTLSFAGTASATSGKTYRLYVTAVVTNSSGTAETVTDYIEKTY